MKKIFLQYFIYLILLQPYALCKETFTLESLNRYLTKDNPYIYGAVGQQYIDAARIQTAQGSFDTKLSAKYDKKDYPVSTGEFADISMSKPTENGTEFIVGYRKAEGVQEYNNIKTGSQGELRLGVTVPVFSLLHDMNKRKYHLDAAKINAVKSTFEAQNNVRNLYGAITTEYYKLLYFNELVQAEKKLLKKAQKRDRFIKKRVQSGDLPQIAILESKQQIINRKQRVLATKDTYNKVLHTVLKYLNISQKEFQRKYRLPSMKLLKKDKIVFRNMLNKALKNRPDLKALKYKKRKLDLDTKYNTLSNYPQLDLFAYGVHDVQYGEGIKVGLKFDIPLERRGYEGKKIEIQKSINQLEERQNQVLLDLKANLTNLIYSFDIVKQNIVYARKEMQIVKELEDAENKKYKIGSSDLFQVNQREIAVLQAQQKLLEYYLNTLIIQQRINQEAGASISL